MKNAFFSIFALGWIDFFNPVAISMVILLIPLVRKRWHTLLYIFGAYIAYASGSIAIFFGVDRYFMKFYSYLSVRYAGGMAAVKIIIGVAAAIGFLFMTAFLIKAARSHRELSMEGMLMIKSVAPWFIILLSFGSTWSNMFAAVAMFAYVGVLLANDIALNYAVFLIPVFCTFSLVPTLTVYILSNYIKGVKFQKIISIIRKIMTCFCLYSIPVLLAIAACWGILGGVGALTE